MNRKKIRKSLSFENNLALPPVLNKKQTKNIFVYMTMEKMFG